MAKTIRYFIADAEKEILYTYEGLVCQEKLNEFLNSLPKSIKEETFPILSISRINGEIKCNLERYFKSENKYYHILEYRVNEDNVDNKEFLTSEANCSTNAYDIYIKWEEFPEIICYIEKIYTHGNYFNIDLSLVYQLLTKVSAPGDNTNILLQKFMECFEFSEIDQIPFHEVQFILDAEQYPSLHLQKGSSYIRMAFENGMKNYQVFNPKFKENSSSFEIISAKSEYALLIERMKNEKNEFGRYVNSLEGSIEAEEVFKSSRSFTLYCISDEGDLYTYQVFISFPSLYEFITNLNSNYKLTKEKTFEELDWDCYENKPILTKVLDTKIVNNNGYRILDFDVKKENINIRTQKAEKVYVKWEENVDLIQYIYDFISSLSGQLQVDWSNISKHFDNLPINEQEKKQLYYAFFSCFKFGKPIEDIPSNVISTIESYSSHKTFDWEYPKSILKQKKELGMNNREFFSLLLESGVVSLPKRLSKSTDYDIY